MIEIQARFARISADRADRLGRQIVALMDAEARYEAETQEAIRDAFRCFDRSYRR
jgi:hypothetical protein